MRGLVLASVAALAFTACTQETPKPAGQAATPPVDGNVQVASAPQPPSVASTIDWQKAQADAAKRPADAPVTIQTAGQQGPSPVPMLLPGTFGAQSATDRPTPPVVTADGYFATYHMPKFDATVNGSNKAYKTPGAAAPPAAAAGAMKFQTSEGAASLSFSRYGANYTIDFECREIDGDKGCITEAEAKDFAEGLFVAQAQPPSQ